MLFRNPIQPIDTRISAGQPLLQMRAGSHVLVARPMKLDPSLPQPFLNIEPSPTLTPSASSRWRGCLFLPLLSLCRRPCHSSAALWWDCPNLPTLLVTSRLRFSWPWDTFLCLSSWVSTLLRRLYRNYPQIWGRFRFFS